MAIEEFKQTAGLYMPGIPYRGGGTIKMVFTNQVVALQHVKAGKLRALAVSSAQLNPSYPDVPTVAGSGYKRFEALSWSGLSVQKGTPQPIVDELEAAMAQVMQSAALKQRLGSQGFVVPPRGSRRYAAFVRSEEERWTRVIKAAGIETQ